MTTNVTLQVLRDDRVVQERRQHNIWLEHGARNMARLMSLSAVDADVPAIGGRPKYVGLGIGGERGLAPPSPTLFACPNSFINTTGTEQRHRIPYDPPITRVERPLLLQGSLEGYEYHNTNPADTGFGWYQVANVFRTSTVMTVVAQVLNVVRVSGAPYQLSEAGLFLADIRTWMPYEPAAAYVQFEPLLYEDGNILRVTWDLTFG